MSKFDFANMAIGAIIELKGGRAGELMDAALCDGEDRACCPGTTLHLHYAAELKGKQDGLPELIRALEQLPYASIKLVRATAADVSDYVRIGRLTASRINCVTTDPAEAIKEINGSAVYLLEVGGQRVGFISYTDEGPDYAYIAEVQVDPDFQGHGVGGFGLGAVLKELASVRTIDLQTHPENPAQKLYERYGFRSTGEIVKNYRNTGEPRMLMVLEQT